MSSSRPVTSLFVRGFVCWAIFGCLGLVGWLSAMTIGLPIVAVALIVMGLTVANYGMHGMAGVVAGAGLGLLILGVLNLGNHPCTGQVFLFAPDQLGSMECGGPDPIPIFAIGSVLIVLGVVSAVVLQLRRRRAESR